jgi:hypothetical protein
MTINSINVTPGQAEVYSVLVEYGPLPDHALVPIVQHVAGSHLSSSGIRSRRKELTDKGLVADTFDYVLTGSNRRAKLYEAV